VRRGLPGAVPRGLPTPVAMRQRVMSVCCVSSVRASLASSCNPGCPSDHCVAACDRGNGACHSLATRLSGRPHTFRRWLACGGDSAARRLVRTASRPRSRRRHTPGPRSFTRSPRAALAGRRCTFRCRETRRGGVLPTRPTRRAAVARG
jgi:hypothetical protein